MTTTTRRSGTEIGVLSGGTVNVAGTVSAQIISAGGTENVLSGGVLSGTPGLGTGIFGTLNLSSGAQLAQAGVSSVGALNAFVKSVSPQEPLVPL